MSPDDQMTNNASPGQTQTRAGSNQLGVRDFNERLILDVVSSSGELSKAEISRITRLSPQTVTVIVNQLISTGLLKKQAAVRGRVGQPSVPIGINPDGATSIGIKIGRRSVEALSMSLDNRILSDRRLSYEFPDSRTVFAWIDETVRELSELLDASKRERLLGIGIAVPFYLDAWEDGIDVPHGAMKGWSKLDIRSRVEQRTGLPCYLLNDASAACLAELTLRRRTHPDSFLYFYVGTFIGGGVVIDGQLHNGRTGHAGSVGSMPTEIAKSGARPRQMVDVVSIHDLERRASAAGLMPEIFAASDDRSAAMRKVFECWAQDAAGALASAIISCHALIETDRVVIDGNLETDLLDEFIAIVRKKLQCYELSGLVLPAIEPGALGAKARAIGGAILPFHENFAVDNSIILKG